ncbi:hypothetical protein PAECIP111892_01074 [Paenibacillus auburnensis]|uniref:Uncharacterized protein n=1 Tax=Paenibacillus auburnensis TaxID=2905649 RepID=A0ABN8FYZ2_9BACL|nr:hypothetical protein PAECIP111892_01074 [Paenibacillus auburnensis]
MIALRLARGGVHWATAKGLKSMRKRWGLELVNEGCCGGEFEGG